MSKINAGVYTVAEILNAAGFDFKKEAAADHLGGAPDYRRVKVGGIGFDDLDKVVNVPYTANELVITVDGGDHTTLEVNLSDDQKEQRKLSFESAADANDE
jgi:hypothetical protein